MKSFFSTGCIILSLILMGYAIFNYAIPTVTSASATPRKIPIYCVATDQPKVALSFDAAWGNSDSLQLLEILAKYNVKATFFMTGEWVEKYPETVKAITNAGHDLGNHSENHKQMSQISASDCQSEIQLVHDKVKELTGKDMILFRPPYGDYNNTLIDAANGMGYHVIQWNIDSLDWKDFGASDIVKRVVDNQNLCNGSIVLMHNGAKYTKDALEQVIVGLQEKGYTLVPISELIYTENYSTDHTGKQIQN